MVTSLPADQSNSDADRPADTGHAIGEIMTSLAELLERLTAAEHSLHDALVSRDYAALSLCLETIAGISAAIQQAERRRLNAMAGVLAGYRAAPGGTLAVDDAVKVTFRALIDSVPDHQRPSLQQLRRRTVAAMASARQVATTIATYTGRQVETMNGILDELLPQRRHVVYSAAGRRHVSGEPMLLDHEL